MKYIRFTDVRLYPALRKRSLMDNIGNIFAAYPLFVVSIFLGLLPYDLSSLFSFKILLKQLKVHASIHASHKRIAYQCQLQALAFPGIQDNQPV